MGLEIEPLMNIQMYIPLQVGAHACIGAGDAQAGTS